MSKSTLLEALAQVLGSPGAISSFCFSFSPCLAAVVAQPCVPLILFGAAAFYMMLGCLWECLTSLLRPHTLRGVHLGFPK